MNPFIDFEHSIIESLFSYSQMDCWSTMIFLKCLNGLREHEWKVGTQNTLTCNKPFDFEEMHNIVKVTLNTAIWAGAGRPNYLATMSIVSDNELPTFVFFGERS